MDDSQDGIDSVDAHRIPALVISPWARKGAVVSTHYDQFSFLRTAELISAEVGGVPVTVVPGLIECDFGAWEALTFAEVQQRWPAEINAWLDSAKVAPPGGESFETVAARARAALGAAVETYAGGVVVLVSHVSPIKLILRDALAASDAFLHRLFLDAAGVSTMDVWPDGNIAVRSVNETSHLR